ncbi:hypothetical protein BC832DRAFT_590293 [Gaertneriomyces semiglobifer]|nr:hypothetical protein BC832DRAFT_590293 [Gaertneriomyces semiglobifer]
MWMPRLRGFKQLDLDSEESDHCKRCFSLGPTPLRRSRVVLVLVLTVVVVLLLGSLILRNDNPPNAQFLDGLDVGRRCWTDETLYEPLRSLHGHTWPAPSVSARTAVLVRTSQHDEFTPDLVLHLRSILADSDENTATFLVVHVEGDEAAQTEWIRKTVPSEFQNIVMTFNTEILRSRYPTFESVPVHNHVVNVLFADKFPQFDFMWIMEADVRLIGKWKTFLGASMEYAIKEAKGLPDLVSFDKICVTEPDWWWRENCAPHWPLEETSHGLLVLAGWSRKLMDAMRDSMVRGVNCYFEAFPPTIARHNGLSTVYVPHPIYYYEEQHLDYRCVTQDKTQGVSGGTFQYQDYGAVRYYRELRKEGKCRKTALLHPIKGYNVGDLN